MVRVDSCTGSTSQSDLFQHCHVSIQFEIQIKREKEKGATDHYINSPTATRVWFWLTRVDVITPIRWDLSQTAIGLGSFPLRHLLSFINLTLLQHPVLSFSIWSFWAFWFTSRDLVYILEKKNNDEAPVITENDVAALSDELGLDRSLLIRAPKPEERLNWAVRTGPLWA